MIDQIEHLNRFNELMKKDKVIQESVITKLERTRFRNVLTKRKHFGPIIKVRCTKPKDEKVLTVHLTRRGDKVQVVG